MYIIFALCTPHCASVHNLVHVTVGPMVQVMHIQGLVPLWPMLQSLLSVGARHISLNVFLSPETAASTIVQCTYIITFCRRLIRMSWTTWTTRLWLSTPTLKESVSSAYTSTTATGRSMNSRPPALLSLPLPPLSPNSDTRSLFGVFLLATRKAHLFVLDRVRTNQMPNVSSLYQNERASRLAKYENYPLPPDDFSFNVRVDTESRRVGECIIPW